MEHTQGKWYIGSIGRNAGRRITIRSHKDPLKGQCVGTVHSQSENAEANARLIAAAPDFAQASKDFIDGWEHFCDCIDFGNSALDARAIQFMNEVPGKIQQAVIKAQP